MLAGCDFNKRVGILGGTFNPIHIGHLILAQNAMEICKLDEILFIPSGVSYFKDPKEIASASDRLQMVKLSIKDNDRFSASDIEIKRSGNTYTYETLRELTSIYPSTKFFFIIGADTLFSIDTWKNPEEIFRLASIICARRDSYSDEMYNDKIAELKAIYNANIKLMDIPVVDISSSYIRQSIKKGASGRYYLKNSVTDYIKEKGLYK